MKTKLKPHALRRIRRGILTALPLVAIALAYILIDNSKVYAEIPSAIEWREDAAIAIAEAKQQEKPVLLRFTAKWCGPCRAMDSSVWSQPEIGQYVAENYIPIELDIDKPSAAEFVRKYRIFAVPSLVLLDTNGQEGDRSTFMSAGQTMDFLNDHLESKS